MSDQTDNNNGYGTALGASVVASALAGAVGSTFFRKKETRTERVQREIDTRVRKLERLANDSLASVSSALYQVSASGGVDPKKARKKGKAISRSASKSADAALAVARKRMSDIDRETLRLQSFERANKLGSQGSARASELAGLLRSRTGTLVDDTRSSVPQWKSKAAQSVLDAREKGASLLNQATASVPDARAAASSAASDASSRASDLIAQTRKRVPEVRDLTAQKAQGATDTTRSRLSGVATLARDKAREATEMARAKSPALNETATGIAASATAAAQSAAERIKERSPELADAASGIATSVAEKVQERAPGVVDSVKEAIHSAQERTPAVVDSVKDVLHSAQEKAQSQVGDPSSAVHKLVEQAKDVSRHATSDLLPDVQHRAASVGSTASEKLSHTTTAIPQKSREAATAAGRGSREAGSLVLWASAAAGVAYYAFLNETQRAKVKASAGRVLAEIRDVYQDMRGMDGDFS